MAFRKRHSICTNLWNRRINVLQLQWAEDINAHDDLYPSPIPHLRNNTGQCSLAIPHRRECVVSSARSSSLHLLCSEQHTRTEQARCMPYLMMWPPMTQLTTNCITETLKWLIAAERQYYESIVIVMLKVRISIGDNWTVNSGAVAGRCWLEMPLPWEAGQPK